MREQKAAGLMAKGAQGTRSNQHKKKEVRVANEPTPTLRSQGIDKNLANRARKMAAIPDGEFERAMESAKTKVRAD